MSFIPKKEVVEKMKESGMIPVFNHPDLETCKGVLKACYDGGARVFEFTKRSESALEVFLELKQYVQDELPEMLLGIGSIIDAKTTNQFIQAGADFIVSPALVPDMADICKENNVVWAPGCGTVSEIVLAQKLGADIVKLFPGAQVGGPSFVKAVLGPLPDSLLMPTGGVSPDRENLKAWLDSGVCCVGMGSKLFPKEWIKNGEFDKLSAKVKNTYSLIDQIRKEM